jgi:branched-chain amino acid transport system substrate-binding protein
MKNGVQIRRNTATGAARDGRFRRKWPWDTSSAWKTPSRGWAAGRQKTVAIYGEDSDWGRSLGGALKDFFEDKGWEIVSEDYFPITQTDFYPLLSKYKKLGCCRSGGHLHRCAHHDRFRETGREVGLESVIIADGLGWMGDWYKMAGPASNGVLDMIPQLTTPEAQKWATDIKAKYGFQPSPSAGGLCYDGTNMFIKILKRTLEKYGELNKVNIHKTFTEEIHTGKLTFSKADGALIMNEYRYNAESSGSCGGQGCLLLSGDSVHQRERRDRLSG